MVQKSLLFGSVGVFAFAANSLPPETVHEIVLAVKDLLMFMLGAWFVPSKGLKVNFHRGTSEEQKEN